MAEPATTPKRVPVRLADGQVGTVAAADVAQALQTGATALDSECQWKDGPVVAKSVSQSSQSVSQGRTGTAEPAGPTGTFPSQIRS